eukprot:1749451-Prymnesium_polylepis.1
MTPSADPRHPRPAPTPRRKRHRPPDVASCACLAARLQRRREPAAARPLGPPRCTEAIRPTAFGSARLRSRCAGAQCEAANAAAAPAVEWMIRRRIRDGATSASHQASARPRSGRRPSLQQPRSAYTEAGESRLSSTARRSCGAVTRWRLASAGSSQMRGSIARGSIQIETHLLRGFVDRRQP